MREKIYKYSVISFVIINFITLYLFYDFLTEKPAMLHGIGLFFDFGGLIFISLGLGIFMLLIRFYLYYRKKKNHLKTNFLYVFSLIFSLNILINCTICVYLGLLPLKMELAIIIAVISTISIFMLTDIYKNNFKENRIIN
ncbi:hypothetical protein DOS84_18780 [Flavobacterium aquariorum]|uniref:Uncharacterized protein n=1 Tax=Flavobacterium aquariorum TaxID=2217670 RepID=A0A2W7U969_9FLAO|nr:hypothetical protein DOS84_18780 [Flavobacterium aquariorum]